ncbi:predicted protein [Naegleria gruberi]|uniref:Predicted protein n=1 Tax=Naegleria gruberi TaxID=5762 RepID=D2V7A8_NAEGR|nr:uncharacterized protein NAEGRDRAFT_64728 [Naegleria gruberi]EFC47342.1 predicted protein [Naegleria gruberi]|eukprot:XP_002680086.1 predicted protein [Naegleria gruberi strain NEG-M]
MFEQELEDRSSLTTKSQVPLLTSSMSRGKMSSLSTTTTLDEQQHQQINGIPTPLSNRKYFGDSELVDGASTPKQHHHHHHHHHPTKPPLTTKAKKIELAKKIGRVVYSLFLLIVMGGLITLDVITQPKNSWISRGSIVIAVTLFGRTIYEFLFEILYEWILDYFITEEIKKPNENV